MALTSTGFSHFNFHCLNCEISSFENQDFLSNHSQTHFQDCSQEVSRVSQIVLSQIATHTHHLAVSFEFFSNVSNLLHFTLKYVKITKI